LAEKIADNRNDGDVGIENIRNEINAALELIESAARRLRKIKHRYAWGIDIKN
jgi:hypothetical protein